MGQQQLLLLVLGIVIVGLAVVVGIQAFSENKKKANADALVNDAIRIASDAQAWKLKPAAFGGGAANDPDDWTGLSFEQLGYTADAGTYENLNGTCELDITTDLVITCTSLTTSDDNNQVEVTVVGTSPADISTLITNVIPAP